MNKHRRSWRPWRLVLKIWRLCRSGLQPRFGLSLCIFVLLMKTLKTFLYFNIIGKRKNKKEHFCSSGSSGETRGYTTSNLITAEGLVTWSSGVFRKFSSHVVKWKSYKKRKLKEVLCVVFRSLKKTRKKCVYFVHNCLQFFTHIHNLQTITPKSYNHTTFKPSYHNHTKITQS